ncbi:FUSC family protein [Rhodovastum atsumiense]|nr:FUSC family protein [Rhodovastum atsumiense]CAH2600660.1 FUSC family protein [Rhodovastum atsumiense]
MDSKGSAFGGGAGDKAPWSARLTGLPSAIVFNPRAISLAEGVRAALAVAVIIAASEGLGWPRLIETALAAWLTCLCDAGGPIRKRVPFLLGFGIVGALVTAGYGLLATIMPIQLAIAVASVGIFCASLLRIYGQPMMQVGNLLTVVQVLALTREVPNLHEAALQASLFLAGNLWALLLTMVIWRVHPYAPARRAVADAWRALAVLSGDLRGVLLHPDPHETEWDRHAREHRRGVREAIETARTAVLQTVRQRGPISGRAAQSSIRLEAADQIFGALIALSDLLQGDCTPQERVAAARMLRRLRPMLVLLAAAIETDAPERLDQLKRAADKIATTAALLPDCPVHRIADTIAERLRVAILVTTPEAFVPGEGPGVTSQGWRTRVLSPLRANLNSASAALRHALRAALAAAVGLALTVDAVASHGYWLTITLVLTMQPYFAVTIMRAAERIAGTVVGGVIGAIIASNCTTPVSMAAALFPLSVVALAVRGVNFGLFMACITPVVVLLVELGRPGQGSEVSVAVLRALYTVGGGVLALLFSALLWPVWEPGRLLVELRAAIVAHGRYAASEIAAVLGEATPQEVEQARRAAGVASNNAEASLQRALLEPSRTDRDRLEAALTIDAALRRIAGRVSAMQVDAATHPHERAAWQAWRDWILEATTRLASGRADLPPRPPVPRDDVDGLSLARIARQLELAAGALPRLG